MTAGKHDESSFAAMLKRPGVNAAVLVLGTLIVLLSVIGLFGRLWPASVASLLIGIGLIVTARVGRRL